MNKIKWNPITKSFGVSEDKWAFLMVYYVMPKYILDIQDLIPEEIVYNKPGYGFELEAHITLAACLDNDIDVNLLKSLTKSYKDYSATIINLSKFDSKPEYDVIKCDVLSNQLVDSNKTITDIFTSHSGYKNYRPHMTVAYVNKGTCDNLLTNLSSPINLTPIGFTFSYYDGDENKKLTWK